MNRYKIKMAPLQPPTENPNPNYKPPIGNKDKDLRDIIFTNAFFQELVLQEKVEPEIFKKLNFKDRHITLFNFAVGNDVLIELICKAGLKKEYEEWKEHQL